MFCVSSSILRPRGIIPKPEGEMMDTYDKLIDELIKMRLEKVRKLLETRKSVYFIKDDEAAGFIPIPVKAEPVRIIPAFPASTYNFLKRP